jgi:RimJ/RimL family protein N-acetyltransferase
VGVPKIPVPDPPLSDGVVSLRPWRPADAPALAAAVQDPDVPRWTAIPSPYSERDAHDYLARVDLDRLAGRELGLAVVGPEDDRLIGSCSLARFDWHDRNAEIGYWIAAAFRRRGAGSRAVVLLSHWAVRELGMERIELLANPANEPSQRLALRAGFTREGLLRAYRRRKGSREDLVMFSLLSSDL